ncbi:CopG family transcriptional regulator [Roseovarius nubinhibens]|uniref:DUF411 domain-containing protein n=1 Tax=Roseovarius nubinhibens TaxID=314263 RepID=UPI001C09AEF8|nr:DUF411 domain-containing protein [Roseovarius nubinhibens]MBU3000095.1 CopG family transcriptional regulator [Roseovarius nubinhibens]
MKKSMIYALVAAPMLSLAPAAHAQSLSEPAAMVMTKTPGCGCCDAWADLARAEGHTVEVIETYDYAGMKADHGVPNDLASCHSVKVGDYVVEGHVPLEAVKRMLRDKPEISGIAVPGMPAGSPGMGDDPKAKFDVMAFGGDAKEGEVYYKAGVE